MKRLLAYILLISATSIAVAQDVAKFAEQDIIGTARYVGMAGAMTAIGGDPTSVMFDNPAGLGLYKHMEVSLTLDLQLDRTWQSGYKNFTDKRNYFIPTQCSFAIPFPAGAGSKIVSHNLFVGYQRLKNYSRTYSAAVNATTSITDVMTDMANMQGTVRNDYGYRDASGNIFMYNDVWDNANVGWLTALGYGTDRMQWDATSPGSADSTFYPYHIPGEVILQEAIIKESGYKNQYSFDYALNIDDRWYLGIGLNIVSVDYVKSVYYGETYTDNAWLDLNHRLEYKGAGINASVGFIGRPTRWMRFGIGFQTPSACTMKIKHYGDAASSDAAKTYNYAVSTPVNFYTDREFRMPLRLSTGLGFQIGNYGLLSLQYNFAHWKNMKNVHSLRVGGEAVIADNFYLNAGYAYESEFLKPNEDYVWYMQPTDVRTDTDFSNLRYSHNASLGFGYRGKYLIAQIAYSLRWQRIGLFPFDLAEPYNMHTMTHRIALTFGFHM